MSSDDKDQIINPNKYHRDQIVNPTHQAKPFTKWPSHLLGIISARPTLESHTKSAPVNRKDAFNSMITTG